MQATSSQITLFLAFSQLRAQTAWGVFVALRVCIKAGFSPIFRLTTKKILFQCTREAPEAEVAAKSDIWCLNTGCQVQQFFLYCCFCSTFRSLKEVVQGIKGD